jgi:hypothetical protein
MPVDAANGPATAGQILADPDALYAADECTRLGRKRMFAGMIFEIVLVKDCGIWRRRRHFGG